MVSYEHFNITLRLPKDEYRRLKKIQARRLLKGVKELRENNNTNINVSMHKIILEAIANFKDDGREAT